MLDMLDIGCWRLDRLDVRYVMSDDEYRMLDIGYVGNWIHWTLVLDILDIGYFECWISWISDVEHLMLDIGDWILDILDIGCWILHVLDIERYMLAILHIGYRMLHIGYWISHVLSWNC